MLALFGKGDVALKYKTPQTMVLIALEIKDHCWRETGHDNRSLVGWHYPR